MIRYIKILLYHLISINKKLNKLDNALNNIDINTLRDISSKAQQQDGNCIKNNVEINLDEDNIQAQYYLAFKAFTKKSIDTPKYACISCTKYCFKRDIIMVKIDKKRQYNSKLE